MRAAILSNGVDGDDTHIRDTHIYILDWEAAASYGTYDVRPESQCDPSGTTSSARTRLPRSGPAERFDERRIGDGESSAFWD